MRNWLGQAMLGPVFASEPTTEGSHHYHSVLGRQCSLLAQECSQSAEYSVDDGPVRQSEGLSAPPLRQLME